MNKIEKKLNSIENFHNNSSKKNLKKLSTISLINIHLKIIKNKKKVCILIFILFYILVFFKSSKVGFSFTLPLFNFSIINYLNLYIIAHKDFTNQLNNSYYKIICDNKNQLKNKYQIKIIETYKNNELYQKKIGYCEGSKIYYIWKKYKKKELSSKYVGFLHYRRIFIFKNNIPNLDKIFTQYDVIINKKWKFKTSMKTQFAKYHFKKFLDEIIEIIKENFTQYYPSGIKTLNGNFLSCCNIFIMKKKDFIKYGDFVFGVLFEFDRRHKLKNDNDIKNLITLEAKITRKKVKEKYQCRQQAFLMERISAIFYDYTFKKKFEIRITSQ